MGYDWENEGTRADQQRADPIPASENVTLFVVRAIYAKQDGTVFCSRNGDPQVMIIFCDAEKREAVQMFTLSDAAGWTLARLVAAMNHDNLAEMKRRGVHPRDFANLEVLEYWLMHPTLTQKNTVGNHFRARITYVTRKSDPNKKDADIVPLRKAPPVASGDINDIPNDEIPF